MPNQTGTRVVRLATTAVKGTRVCECDSVELEESGARGNRRFFVIDERDRMLNGKQVGALNTIVSQYDAQERRLILRLADGGVVDDVVRHGEPVQCRFFSRQLEARPLIGPWTETLGALTGQALRIAEPVDGRTAVDRGRRGGVSLISQASLARLAEVAQQPGVDARRFRMLIEVDGLAAHAEDRWVGRRVAVGDAQIRLRGHVGRCLVTSRDPESGEIDLPTLDLLRSYRGEAEATEPLPFGVYGEVVRAGTVRVGDPVEAI